MLTANLFDETFRASPRFELKRLDELTPEQRGPLEELERDGDFYGLLIPRQPSAANIKSVTRDAADLFCRLAAPSKIEIDSVAAEELIDFVLDGVIEIFSEGDFVSGADALPIVCGAPANGDRAGVSYDALRYAADLEESDAGTLTTALYLYNRIPLSPFWKSRFPNRDAVLAHIGASTATAWHILPEEQSNGWIAFHARARRVASAGVPTYKLYVSPRPENIRDAFEAVAGVLAPRGIDFKIGRDAAGLLRPDKLMIYAAVREEIDEIAAALLARLAGCPAHGVPFTAPIGDDALLSWGLDPPDSERALSWLGRESWRLWLAGKLGTAIAFAKTLSSRRSVEPWRFAVERVRRLGVDVDRWTPGEALWRSA
jgi:hypothetical protein